MKQQLNSSTGATSLLSSNQESRRGSHYESQHRESPQHNGQLSTENKNVSTFNAGNKFMQDSFETEKSKSSRASPIADDSKNQAGTTQRKNSIRFFDEVQSVNEPNTTISETLHQEKDDSVYEYKNVSDYNQALQNQNSPSQNQVEYTDHPLNTYASNQYNTTQYINQQNYDSSQYEADDLQQKPGYNYQTEYQDYDVPKYEHSEYQNTEQPNDQVQQQEQFFAVQPDGTTSTTFDSEVFQPIQQRQSYTESSFASNVGQKYNNAPRQQNMSKQSAKKKYT